MPIKKHLHIIISCFFFLVLIFIPILFFLANHQYDLQGPNIVNPRGGFALNDNEKNIGSIEQIFKAKNNNLNYVNLTILDKKNSISISMQLSSLSDNITIAEQKFNLTPNENYQILNLNFTPVENSKDKIYKISVSGNLNDVDFIAVPPDRYPEGKLLINQQQVDGVLIFGFQYYTNNIFKILINRIGMFKPWFFRNGISFAVIFFIYIILASVLSCYLIKKGYNADD